MNMHRAVKSGTIAAILLGVLGTSAAHAASIRRIPASNCFAETNDPWDTYESFGHLKNRGWSKRYLACPVEDFNVTYDHKTASQIWVHGFDSNPNDEIAATACASDPWGIGGWCGSTDTSGNAQTGDVTLTPSTTAWNQHEHAFSYVYVTVPREWNGHSSLAGITVFYP